MKVLTDTLTEIQATILEVKSRNQVLESVSLSALEKNIKKAIKLGKDVQQQLDILRNDHAEVSSTVDNQEQDLIK